MGEKKKIPPFTPVANTILDEIAKVNLNGTQFRILLIIWRNTYGVMQQTKGEFSLATLATKAGTNRGHINRELNTLIRRNFINDLGTGKKGARILSFNKNHDEWLDEPAKEQKKPAGKKKSKASNVKDKYGPDNTYFKMAQVFHELVTEVAKDAGVEHLTRKANLQTWADDFRKLVELDGVEDKVQIHRLMKWVTQHDFWRTNVLSAKKFREKYAELAIKMSAEQKKKDPYKHPSHYQEDNRDYEIALNKWIAAGGDPDDFDPGE